ncbi:TAXI family TRAP transporter solute-binding subunit [Hyphobacterium sp.]|uniref:TAXI family TRAP transporter solute-binding subunit n=1 Tax=Hyphobacterium sp. TaxID=2004662 RepID=UPI003749ECFD
MPRFFLMLLAAIVLVPASGRAWSADPSCLATGQPGGRYLAFAERLQELSPDSLPCIIETDGSVENLRGLQAGRFGLAIAQSDLTYHAFNGDHGFDRWRDFSVIAPLFPEFVQVLVRRDENGIFLLGDLRGQTINIGVPGSGGFINARDVLATAGLREGVDFLPHNLPAADALDALADGTVDAVFLTANAGYEYDQQAFRQLSLPPGIIADLASTNVYYEASEFLIEGQQADALAVRAFLLTRNDTPRSDIRALTRSLLDRWETLSGEFPGLHSPENFLLRTPLPYNAAARSELVRQGFANPPPAYALWIAIWATILLSSFLAVSFQTTYDRTGTKRERRGRYAYLQMAADIWARPSPWVIGISLFVLTLLIALVGLRSAEAAHARAFNLDNPFADLTLTEGFIWMLTFVASGFTENNAYPLSIPGRILVAVLAFIGVSGPIAAIIIVVNLWGKRRAEKVAGLTTIGWKDHILVCGWNEHLDGVVFALTGNDAETAKKVCIIGESGDATPLQDHKFDPGKVRFRRGDSADRETLEYANAKQASHAIILADYARRSSRNIGAVLTAMNLKRQNPDIRISAELAFDQNADHFAAFGCSTLITPDIFIAKAASLCTVHPLMIDYLLEVLTYDSFDELFSIDFADLCERNSDIKAGMTTSELEECLWSSGANLVGLVQGDLQRDAVFDAEVIDGGPIISFTRRAGYAHVLAPHDRIIYSAHKRDSVFKTRGYRDVLDAPPIAKDKFVFERSVGKRILLYASRSHLRRLEANLRAFHLDADFHSIAIEDTPFLTAGSLAAALPPDVAFDHILILANSETKRRADSDTAVRSVDAATLLATKLLREHARARGWECEIVSEVLAREDRDAFSGKHSIEASEEISLRRPSASTDQGAGATAIVPSATLVERFLVKDVFDGNAMLDFLIAVMNMRDGTHLFMHEIGEADALIGETYASLVRTRHPGLHLVGWLPVSKRGELRNRAGDFGYHFRTSYDSRIDQKEIRAGDLLVFTICFDIWDGKRPGDANDT